MASACAPATEPVPMMAKFMVLVFHDFYVYEASEAS
jgi:hypothetical protein